MYKPLKNRVHKYFCFLFFFNATTASCWAISKPLPTESVDFFFISKKKKNLLTRNILDEKKFTKMNVLFKIIHAF